MTDWKSTLAPDILTDWSILELAARSALRNAGLPAGISAGRLATVLSFVAAAKGVLTMEPDSNAESALFSTSSTAGDLGVAILTLTQGDLGDWAATARALASYDPASPPVVEPRAATGPAAMLEVPPHIVRVIWPRVCHFEAQRRRGAYQYIRIKADNGPVIGLGWVPKTAVAIPPGMPMTDVVEFEMQPGQPGIYLPLPILLGVVMAVGRDEGRIQFRPTKDGLEYRVRPGEADWNDVILSFAPGKLPDSVGVLRLVERLSAPAAPTLN